MLKKTVSYIFISAVYAAFTFASPVNSASSANRRTAIRYLQLSKQFASEKLWSEADSNAKMGLAYDDKIADLWYLRAVSQMNLGEKKYAVLPLVVTALTEAEWVDYNRDGARILYADILCTTRQYTQSLSVLDSSPFIYSADAEYIRAKNYYCLGDEENLKKARSRIDSARRVYPADERFAELFYSHEYQIFRKTEQKYSDLSDDVRSLADAFALTVPLYKNAKNDLEIFAAIFSSDEKPPKGDSKKVRMLKAFNSKGFTSPLYAIEALKSGLLTEDSALDYFYKFSDLKIELSVLEDFAALLKGEEVKKEFSEYLNSYNGTVVFDTDGDLISNMTVIYKRGRPESIFYDENQDDENEWTSICDFGVPQKISMSENALELEYSSWPYISFANYKMESLHSDLRISLIAETLEWTPFNVAADISIKNSLNFEFFIPVILSETEKKSVSSQKLIKAALSYSIPSKEREGAVIQVSLLNGVAQIAGYSVGDKIYAMAQFENGIPVSRKVDINGDGLFETTEFYGFTTDQDQKFISTNDELQIMTNLFGSAASGSGFYLKKITVDQNGDTVPDFIEEYLPASEGNKIPGKISSWDTNGDGVWDVQYVKQPSSVDGKVREEAKFFQPFTNMLVTVYSEDSVPVSVQRGTEILSVVKGNSKNFYWISNTGTQKNEENIIKEINQTAEQGVSIVVESDKKRFLAVRIEKNIFGMEIQN
ncbi:hypothetical protein [Treponema sp.]|uniref:hypothetical protein n=1 Tax=Treponema sp. TaxID=166 RepID=UPI00388E607E